VDNPDRTAAHLAQMDQRRRSLAEVLGGFLGKGSSIIWEIGCGHGHFLTSYAQAHPNQTCVGIDIASERIERAQRKCDRVHLSKLHFLRADAGMFLDVLPTDTRFSDIYLIFPDPWPKKRHQKHRLVQPEFLHIVAQKAEANARLFFRTDFRPYFEHATEVLVGHPEWQLAPPNSPWPFEQETVFQRRAPVFYSLTARRRQA
jgi:tRNA (guanine-N7-)-methyltransferase